MTELIVNNAIQLLHEWIVWHYSTRIIDSLSTPIVPLGLFAIICITTYKLVISGKIK